MLLFAERQAVAAFLTRVIRVARSSPRDGLALALPFVTPFLAAVAYEPINHGWTVATFGCGCPNVDGTFRTFDANTFNMILWSIIGAICIRGWRHALTRFPCAFERSGWIAGGCTVIIVSCLKMFAQSGWL